MDPNQNHKINHIIKIVAHNLKPNLPIQSLKKLNLKPQNTINLHQKSQFTNFLTTISKILQIPIPTIYQSTTTHNIRKKTLYPPIIIIKPKILTKQKKKKLHFLINKTITYFLPKHTLTKIYPINQLHTFLLSTLTIIIPNTNQNKKPKILNIQQHLKSTIKQKNINHLHQLTTTINQQKINPNLHK